MAATFASIRGSCRPLFAQSLGPVPSLRSGVVTYCENIASTNNLWSIQLRTATKKAGGSSNNGRDSAGRRLGVKIFPNRPAKAGSIIVRQRGRKFYAGENVGMGKDHTIFSKIDGIVRFTKHEHKRKKNIISVVSA